VLVLARNAALRGRISEQALEIDLRAAIGAEAERAFLCSLPRSHNVAEFLDVAVKLRRVEVGERRRHRLISAVGHAVEQFHAMLVTVALGGVPNILQHALLPLMHPLHGKPL
jgi:hypothetical protein